MSDTSFHDAPTYVPTGDEFCHGCASDALPHDDGDLWNTLDGAQPGSFASGVNREASRRHRLAYDFAQGHECGLHGFMPSLSIRHLFSTAWHSGHAVALTFRARAHCRSERQTVGHAHNLRRADSVIRFRDHGAVELP